MTEDTVNEMQRVTPEIILRLVPERNRATNSDLVGRVRVFSQTHNNFTVVVIADGRLSEKLPKYYSGVCKRDPYTDEGDLERGLQIALNRAWRLFSGLDPGYGKGHPDPESPKRALRRLRMRIRAIAAESPKMDLWPAPGAFARRGRQLIGLVDRLKKLDLMKKGAKDAAAKPAHS